MPSITESQRHSKLEDSQHPLLDDSKKKLHVITDLVHNSSAKENPPPPVVQMKSQPHRKIVVPPPNMAVKANVQIIDESSQRQRKQEYLQRVRLELTPAPQRHLNKEHNTSS